MSRVVCSLLDQVNARSHHDVLVWTLVNAHFILRRICHTLRLTCSAPRAQLCYAHTAGRIGNPSFVLTDVVLSILFEITP